MADVNIKVQLQAAQAEAQLAKFNAQLSITSDQAKQATLKTQILEQNLKKATEAANGSGKGFTVANVALASFIGNITSRLVSSGITGIINGFKNIIQTGREFEDGLVSIGKTTGISGKSLDSLGNEITKLSQKIPVSAKELLELGTVAGQLGLKSSSDILKFTETMAKLTLATDISGEQGSQSVARILTVTGELEKNGTQNIAKFGNVITRLGNNFAATESQILEVANRVGKGIAPFGVASEDILAISTALKATGTEAEAGGSAIQKTFLLIGEATQEGGDKLRNFAEAAGLSTEEFKKLFEADPAKLFQQLTKNLGETSKGGADLNARLKELGLSDIRLINSLNPLIAKYGTLEKALMDARAEAKEGTALNEEAGKAANTLSGDIAQLSNSFDALSKTLFAQFGPTLRTIVQLTSDFINFVNKNANTMIGSFTAIGAAAAIMWLGITGPVGIAIAGLAALSISLGILEDETRAVDQATQQYKQNLTDLNEAYKESDSDTKTLIDSYSEVIGATNNVSDNLVELNTNLKETKTNYVEVAGAAETAAETITKSTKEIVLFEQDKLRELKKFFNSEEQAKLISNFNILKSDKEREDYTKFIASEGEKRQREAFARTIGLDKASLDAKKTYLDELKKLRDAQGQYEEELKQKEIKREEEKITAQNAALEAERAIQIFKQEGRIQFEEEQLQGVQDFLTREEQARLAAQLEATTNEQEKQTIIANIQKKALDGKLANLQKNAEDEKKIEELKNQAILSSSANFFGAFAAIARTGGTKALGIYKTLATAQAVISTYAAINKTLADPALPWPANTIQAIAIGAQGFANVANIQQQSFETGGIVRGTSFTGDKVQARVNSGEMILNRSQQSQLFNMANGQGGGSQPQEIVVHTTVELDGEKVGNSVSRQVANGLVLGEVQ